MIPLPSNPPGRRRSSRSTVTHLSTMILQTNSSSTAAPSPLILRDPGEPPPLILRDPGEPPPPRTPFFSDIPTIAPPIQADSPLPSQTPSTDAPNHLPPLLRRLVNRSRFVLPSTTPASRNLTVNKSSGPPSQATSPHNPPVEDPQPTPENEPPQQPPTMTLEDLLRTPGRKN